MCFSFIHRILTNWLKVKFMGGDDSVDTRPDAGGVQTLALFNAPSSKGNQRVFVNVCVMVSDSHFVCLLLWFSYFHSLLDITGITNT